MSTDTVAPWRLLAAMAVHPGLHALLIIDAGNDDLKVVARDLQACFYAAHTNAVLIEHLPSFADEPSLWSPGKRSGSGSPWSLPAGLFGSSEQNARRRIICIRNLSDLSQSAARACVQLIGSEAILVEYQGHSLCNPNRVMWLAACPNDAIEMVSSHLLERFPLRIRRPTRSAPPDRVAALAHWINSPAISTREKLSTFPLPRMPEHITWPQVAEGLLERIEELNQGAVGGVGARRPLAVLRLAVALAVLDGVDEAGPTHLQEALRILRGSLRSNQDPTDKAETPTPIHDRTTTSESKRPAGERNTVASPGSRALQFPVLSPSPTPSTPAEGTLAHVDTLTALPALNAETAGLYVEDTPAVNRAPGSLQLRGVKGKLGRGSHGVVIGIRSAEDGDEIALAPTLLAAIPFQILRRRNRVLPDNNALLLVRSDLRSWRRAPIPSRLLTLVLDATAYPDRDWSRALAPFIASAYVERSPLCLVLVGADEAPDPYRAERLVARNILVPEVRVLLNRGPGRATPLADGLRQAFRTLAESLQGGHGISDRATLVVLSDGRGNVPLNVSDGAAMISPVSLEGFDDALTYARRIARLPGIKRYLLDPQPTHALHLTEALVEALDAEQIPIQENPTCIEEAAV